MPLTVNFEFEDSLMLFHTAVTASRFREDDQSGRFHWLNNSQNHEWLPEQVFALAAFEHGTMLWTDSSASALLLRNIHKAEGYEAYVFGDSQAEDVGEFYAVLTSWDLSTLGKPLSEEVVIAEILFTGEVEPSVDFVKPVLEEIAKNHAEEVLGVEVSDHEDHFHVAVTVRLAGELLPALTEEASNTLDAPVGYQVISS